MTHSIPSWCLRGDPGVFCDLLEDSDGLPISVYAMASEQAGTYVEQVVYKYVVRNREDGLLYVVDDGDLRMYSATPVITDMATAEVNPRVFEELGLSCDIRKPKASV